MKTAKYPRFQTACRTILYSLPILYLLLSFQMELAHAQTQLLDSTELAKEKIYISEKKVYLSIDEALESPNAVYNLDLSRKNLKELSIEIKKFKNLKELNLSNNNLTSLQNELSGLQNLEILR